MTAAERIAAVGPLVETLLPGSATPLMRAMLAAELASLAAVDPTVIATVWDPMRCPAVLLPWLAWALSVDVWDPDWSEARKRRVIAAAPLVHRLKGTRGAVERALGAFELDAAIVEWWQEEPPARRGTFRVDVRYRNGGPAFDPVTQAQAIVAARAAKPKSRVMTARAVIQAEAPLFAAAYTRSALSWTIQPYAFAGLIAEAPIFAAALPAALLTHTILPKEPA